MKFKKPIGITIFSWLIILASMYKLIGFIDRAYYHFMFQQLSYEMITMRYFLSILLRVLGIGVAIGLLLRRKPFEKMIIILCVIQLAAIYWKHPTYVFKNIAIYNEYVKDVNDLPAGTKIENRDYPLYPKDLKGYQLNYTYVPWITQGITYAIDIVFVLTLLYYFTRRRVIEEFR